MKWHGRSRTATVVTTPGIDVAANAWQEQRISISETGPRREIAVRSQIAKRGMRSRTGEGANELEHRNVIGERTKSKDNSYAATSH